MAETMMVTKPQDESEHEGVDDELIAIQNEYLKYAPGVNWIELGVINHMDTWCVDPMQTLL